MQIKSLYGTYRVVYGKADKFLKKLDNPYMIIDRDILRLYPHLREKYCIIVDANENSKEYSNIKIFIDKLLKLGIKRNDMLVGIGGGVIQDITGFIASILFRGIEWHYYPTTLLSQADSCIGSKTSINIEDYKNQVGTFYPPKIIVIDTKFLNTLPDTEILSGYGEIIKYHILDDNFELISNNYKKLIKYSLEVKRRFIEKDEFDRDIRRKLNYGHTFGHALESSTNFGVSHGIAVLIGMDISNYISHEIGLDVIDYYDKVSKFIREYLVDIKIPKPSVEDMINNLKKDKKNTGDELTFIGLTINGPEIIDLPYDRVKEYLEKYYENSMYDTS